MSTTKSPYHWISKVEISEDGNATIWTRGEQMKDVGWDEFERGINCVLIGMGCPSNCYVFIRGKEARFRPHRDRIMCSNYKQTSKEE